MDDALARHGPAISGAGIAAAAVAMVVAIVVRPDSMAIVFLPVWLVAAFGVLAFACGVVAARRPVGLRVGTGWPAFVTRRHGGPVFVGLAAAWAGVFLLTVCLAAPASPGAWLLGLAAGAIGLAVALLPGFQRGLGIRLTPTGIAADRVAGSLWIPWEALSAEQRQPDVADEHWIRLAYERPELVERNGVVLGRPGAYIEEVDVWFAGAAVAHYAADPRHRPAIGTPEELDRLRAALATSAPTLDPRSLHVLWWLGTGAVLVAAGSVVLEGFVGQMVVAAGIGCVVNGLHRWAAVRRRRRSRNVDHSAASDSG